MKKYLTVKATIEIDDEENNINTFDDCLNDYDNIGRPLAHLKDTDWLIEFVSLDYEKESDATLLTTDIDKDRNTRGPIANYGKITLADVKTIRLDSYVRYWEDAIVNGEYENDETPRIPCAKEKHWIIDIDAATGNIENWKKGLTGSVFYKTCDENAVTLYDKEGNILCEYEGYVPECFSIDDKGFGDYIMMTIDENGKIKNWKFTESDLDEITGKKE